MYQYSYFYTLNTQCILLYGYQKRGTPARVMSPTLSHGNSKNDRGQEKRERKKEEGEH